MKCEKHDFHWDISDPMGCPICYGISISIKNLEEEFDALAELGAEKDYLMGLEHGILFLKNWVGKEPLNNKTESEK